MVITAQENIWLGAYHRVVTPVNDSWDIVNKQQKHSFENGQVKDWIEN